MVGRPVSIRFEFLFSQLASEAPYTYSLPNDPHAVPGLGVCALDDGEESIFCRAPFGDFGFVTASTTGSLSPCDASPDTSPIPAPPIPETGFLIGPRRQQGNPMPLISPVMVNELRLYAPHNQPFGHPCPGTPVTFVVRRSQRRIYLATPPATITLNTPPRGGRLGP